MALGVSIPASWGNLKVYFAITVDSCAAQLDWPVAAGALEAFGDAEEDYVVAARVAGASDWRIILRHLLPGFASYLIVSLTLEIPRMILGETTLSFFKLGFRPPTVSWGVLLQDAQNLAAISVYPWLMFPAVMVVVCVLAFNFLGRRLAGRGGSLQGITMTATDTILDIRGLTIRFHTRQGLVTAVDGLDLSLRRGSVLGLVGESGCGKTVMAHSLIRIEAPEESRAARSASSGRTARRWRSKCSTRRAPRFAAFAGKKSPWCFRSR